jgi:gamma-glutamylcyclotransferase (GGCT)/AIG2-like uncharacterized protein YtfP
MGDGMVYALVYGTLRAGETNDVSAVAQRHDLPTPECLGRASVTGHLYDFGRYPGLVLDAEGSSVNGEVYELPLDLVSELDEIEAVYPGRSSIFTRGSVIVKIKRRELPCQVYLVAREEVAQRPRIQIGDWVTYRKRRDER